MKSIEFLITLTFFLIFFYFVFFTISKNLPENYYKDKFFILKTLNQMSLLNLRDYIYKNETEKIKNFLKNYLNYEFDFYICDFNCSYFISDQKFSIKYFFFGYEDLNPKILILYVG